MRYHHQQTYNLIKHYGEVYVCDHPVYNACTLYKIQGIGLSVIQQRFDISSKRTWWGPIDPDLSDDIYLNKGFIGYFHENAKPCDSDGLYPTLSVRQLMWALRMKPLPRQRWETVFDHRWI